MRPINEQVTWRAKGQPNERHGDHSFGQLTITESWRMVGVCKAPYTVQLSQAKPYRVGDFPTLQSRSSSHSLTYRWIRRWDGREKAFRKWRPTVVRLRWTRHIAHCAMHCGSKQSDRRAANCRAITMNEAQDAICFFLKQRHETGKVRTCIWQ